MKDATQKLLPTNDDIVRSDWRGPSRNPPVQIPGAGCYGAPLSEPCPESHAEAGAWCATCGGSGRVRPGKPKTKTPTP